MNRQEYLTCIFKNIGELRASLPMARLALFASIHEKEGFTASMYNQHFDLVTGSINRDVTNFTSRGYLISLTENSSHDKRKKIFKLTPAGREYCAFLIDVK